MIRATVYTAVLSLASSVTANAALTVNASPTPPHQVGVTNQVQVGLVVRGETSERVLSVGGGYTLICEGQTNGAIEAENGASQANVLVRGIVLTVTVPAVVPTQYVIQGWNSWQPGSTHQCQFKYRGRATEAVSGLTGTGFGFSFGLTSGGTESTQADTRQFVMMKPLPPPPPPPGGGLPCPSCTCTPP